jgi:hypothetical protein
MATGILPLRQMITGIYRLEQCKEAFAKASERGTLKILFDLR